MCPSGVLQVKVKRPCGGFDNAESELMRFKSLKCDRNQNQVYLYSTFHTCGR